MHTENGRNSWTINIFIWIVSNYYKRYFFFIHCLFMFTSKIFDLFHCKLRPTKNSKKWQQIARHQLIMTKRTANFETWMKCTIDRYELSNVSVYLCIQCVHRLHSNVILSALLRIRFYSGYITTIDFDNVLVALIACWD